MAFNLLVELPLDFSDWEILNLKLGEYSNFGIECFPISNNEVFSGNYLGIAVIGGEMTADRINAFKEVILYLLECRYQVFELYSSSQFLIDNVEPLIKKFFI
jgi:hypothetical protein